MKVAFAKLPVPVAMGTHLLAVTMKGNGTDLEFGIELDLSTKPPRSHSATSAISRLGIRFRSVATTHYTRRLLVDDFVIDMGYTLAINLAFFDEVLGFILTALLWY